MNHQAAGEKQKVIFRKGLFKISKKLFYHVLMVVDDFRVFQKHWRFLEKNVLN